MKPLPEFARAGAIAVVLGATILTGCASTGTSTSNGAAARPENPATMVAAAERQRQAATRTGEIYLMRGLMDVFSRGIDQMAAQMRRNGLYAVDTSYTEWESLGADIVRRAAAKEVSYPIIIIGHSLGANEASKLASYLGNKGIEVALVVTFDPTEPGYVGKNITTVVNYYLPNENNRIYRKRDFKGQISNVDMSRDEEISHTTIEKNPQLQAKTIARVMRLTRKKR